jgi:hypothetical protein
MGRNLNQALADLPADRRARIDARYRKMKAEIERLRELRRVAATRRSRAGAAKRTAKAR